MKYIICELYDFFSSGFFSTILGAIIGYYGSLMGVKRSEKGKNIDEISRKIRIFSAMRTEFTFLLERYKNVYGDNISNTIDGSPIDEFSASKEDYFTVYMNNSEVIGDIKNEETREAIIKSYILSKAIMEEFEINNSIYEENRNSTRSIEFLNKLSCYGSVIREDNNNLINFAGKSISGLLYEINLLNEEKDKITRSYFKKFKFFKK